jgi:large subunit ribosomal protein L10e
MTPARKITRFDMGENKPFEYALDLIPQTSIQIRQESMESARQTSTKVLEKNIAKGGFHFKIRMVPYHILRENPLAAGAGADRVSTGMQKSFGKPIGVAVQVKKGDKLFTISVDGEHVKVARQALVRASKKMPCSFKVRVNQLPKAK